VPLLSRAFFTRRLARSATLILNIRAQAGHARTPDGERQARSVV